jgi:hypothetical protein
LELVKHYSREIDCGAYRVSDPYSFDTDPDPGSYPDSGPGSNLDPGSGSNPYTGFFSQGFDDTKRKNLELEKKIFFLIKNYSLPIPWPT